MQFLTRLYRASAVASGLILFLLALTITTDVIKRWIFGRPFVGVFEISQIAFLALTFLALALVEYRGRQMRVDLITSRLKGKLSRVVQTVTALISFGFWLLILWQGTKEWLNAYEMSDVRLGMIEIPTVIPLGFLVFGTALICTYLISLIARYFRGHQPPD